MAEQSSLQSPFLQQDLLPLSGFISYCRDNGVDTDREELEYYDQEKLLVPAVRVIRGIVVYRKIFATFDGKDDWRRIFADDLNKFKVKKLDPKEYYACGSLSYGSGDWMNWYTERDMIKYPAQEGYIPWSTFDIDRDDQDDSFFGSDPKAYENASELMYAKHQIFPLSDVKNYRTLIVKDKALFRTPAQWTKEGKYITEMFSKGTSNQFVRKNTVAWNCFLGLLTDVQSLIIGRNATAHKVYRESFASNGGDRKEALRDGQSAMERYDTQAKTRASEVLDKHKFSVDDIRHWQHKVLSRGSFGVGANAHALRAYITRLDNSLLDGTEDAYTVVNQLSWFLESLGEKRVNAKQLILGSMNETCAICGKYFKPTRSTQKTCGSEECQQRWQNELKRRKRRSGEYK